MMTSIMHCEIKKENDSATSQSETYIKEEIMLPDMTESTDSETSGALSHNLQDSKVLFDSLCKNENILTYIKQNCNEEASNSDEKIDSRELSARLSSVTSSTLEANVHKDPLKTLDVISDKTPTKQQSAELECPKCGKKYKTKWVMLRHKDVCGINVCHLKCKFCAYDTKYKNNMMKHIHTVHKHIKPEQLAGIMKKIMNEGEKIRALHLDDGLQINTMRITIDYKRLILLYCSKCNEIYKNMNYKKQRDCSKCGTVTLLQCIKCAKRYLKTSSMRSHLSLKCAAQNNYQCAHCDYISTSKKTLKNHINRRHRIVGPEDFEWCCKCNKRFRNRLDRITHEKYCPCEPYKLCPFQCNVKESFKRHIQNHILHPDVDLSVSTVLADTVRNHVKAGPTLSKKDKMELEKLAKAVCPKCNKSVMYAKQRKQQCRKCETKLTYPCNKCGKVYAWFNNLRLHVISNHLSVNTKGRQQCSTCGKRFALYQYLRLHEYYCLKQPDQQCEYCPFRTKYRGSLIKHMQKKHDEEKNDDFKRNVVHASKKLVCPQCSKGYTTDTGLRKHRQFYCGNDPSFACDHCSYKTTRKYTLIIHLLGVHNHLFTDQKLRCRHCGKESTNVYMYNIHVADCSVKLS